MSDANVPDSQKLGEYWCPTCQPHRDPSREILIVQYCSIHEPSHSGPDDSSLGDFGTQLGNAESGGETNRLWNEFFKKKGNIMRVIGISGKIDAGKDAIAAHLVNAYNFQVVRFSDELKEEVLRILRKTCEEIWYSYYRINRSGYAGNESPDESDLRWMLWTDKPPIVRRLLQEWGTELRRNEQPGYWVAKWAEKIRTLTAQDISVVAPDTRFRDEASAVHLLGGVVLRVERPGLPVGDHASELEADSLKYDHVIQNTGTLLDLASRVDEFLAR